jgi:hypothetical protein
MIIEGQAFMRSYDSAPGPPPPPLSHEVNVTLSPSSWTGEGGRVDEEPNQTIAG